MMQRLRKGRELERERDIKEVQRDLSLIRSPAAGMFMKQCFYMLHLMVFGIDYCIIYSCLLLD